MAKQKSFLEPAFADDYQAWSANPTPATTGQMLRVLQPAIDRGISAHVGQNVSPTMKSHARKLALSALRTYDPSQSRLGTHVINHLQGLKRISRKQQQILSVLERVSLDQAHVDRASKELDDRLGRPPSAGELADYTGLSLKRIGYVQSYSNPVAEGSLLSFVDEENQGGMMPAVNQGGSPHILADAIYDELDPINQHILDWSLGLHGRQLMPVQAIAAKLRMTSGAVSQRRAIIQKKMDELRQTSILS